jgi:hypothetical protein
VKVLFDNNVPVPLRRHLLGHEVTTARALGWHELRNGDLLTAAEGAGFEVLVTGDKRLSYQQNLTLRKLALVILPTIDWSVLRTDPTTLEAISAAVDHATAGSFKRLESGSEIDRR